MIWHGYLKERVLSHTESRKVDESPSTATPIAVLRDPEEVADWLIRTAEGMSKHATTGGQVKNALLSRSRSALLGAARKGKSAYTTAHLSTNNVVHVCAEVVATFDESACSRSANGHNFQKNPKGEWRCINCGNRM